MRSVLVQLESTIDSARNRDLVAQRLDVIEAGSADLVVLPEATMHDFGSVDHDLAAVAEPLDGPFVSLLTSHAARLDTTIVAGMFEQVDGGLPFNTLVAVNPDGLVASYRKIHLYDSFGYRESDRLAAGPIQPVVLDVADVRLGLMTCYDLRFPEHARIVVDAGAEVLVLPAAWVAGDDKLHHWRTLATARAIENTVYVVAAAQGGARYTGHSIVVDPLGRVIAEAGSGDETISADISPGTVTAARDVNPSLANRRIR